MEGSTRMLKLNDAEIRYLAEKRADDDPVKPDHLAAVANHFENRFKYTRQANDIEQAISIRRNVCELTPDGHKDQALRLSMLATCLQSCFKLRGDPGDEAEALTLLRVAAELDETAEMFNNLAGGLFNRFEREYDIADIDEAIEAQKKAVELTPIYDAAKPSRLSNLAHLLFTRLKHGGPSADIDEAIVRDSSMASPPPHHSLT
ncbi:hypothetical protein CYLTODRAFT_453726 [Cylindrobasidium torrendii FP15055 ss-10]|uniref:TPR-like protein n=1 Tax=Cylindrobasidium torrendii FP15055 ss-10 TaxID=1314674 RepID=A0A0D7BDR2_9AGAR|nr:hypothetical protein CYLTODRAFT_453726 [Cylindrobasidium torrendii FP15055 ss-10]